MNNLDYNLYVLAEIAYKNEHQDLKEDDLYPNDWYGWDNYREKSELIASAIKERKLIKDTNLYKEYVGKKHL